MEKEIQLVMGYLDKIAEKLGVGIEHIWPWFIRQQYIEAILCAIAVIITVPLCAITVYLTLKYWREDNKYSYYNDNRIKKYSIYHSNHESAWITANIIVAVLVLVAIILFSTFSFNVFNPEYHAFKDIISLTKPIS